MFFITFGVSLLPVFTGHCYRVVKTRQNPSKPVKTRQGPVRDHLIRCACYIKCVHTCGSSFLVVFGCFPSARCCKIVRHSVSTLITGPLRPVTSPSLFDDLLRPCLGLPNPVCWLSHVHTHVFECFSCVFECFGCFSSSRCCEIARLSVRPLLKTL